MTIRKDEDYYASMIAPGTKKVTIVSRRVGAGERLHAIATCNNEGVADKIVSALNMQQGELEKLEAPAERVLKDVREQLTEERALTSQLRADVRALKDEARKQQIAYDGELRRVSLERDEARKGTQEVLAQRA